MKDENERSILKTVWATLCGIVLFGFVGWLLVPQVNGGLDADKKNCQGNLSQFGKFVYIYRTAVPSNSFPPVSSEMGDKSWGEFIRRVKVDANQWEEVHDELFVCPERGAEATSTTNHYAWATPDHPVFKNGLAESLPDDTPIAGDAVKEAPGVHIRIISTINGSVSQRKRPMFC